MGIQASEIIDDSVMYFHGQNPVRAERYPRDALLNINRGNRLTLYDGINRNYFAISLFGLLGRDPTLWERYRTDFSRELRFNIFGTDNSFDVNSNVLVFEIPE